LQDNVRNSVFVSEKILLVVEFYFWLRSELLTPLVLTQQFGLVCLHIC
jgi:hypothetical protein